MPLAFLRQCRIIGSVPRLVTVIETETFARRADKLLDSAERDVLITFLALNPTAGDVIEGTGGVRKVRFAAQGKGKSGGVRVIHYFVPDAGPLYALLLYAKSERTEMSAEQRKMVIRLAAVLKAASRTGAR